MMAGPFTLPELAYATDALEPHIDKMTMEIHHGKHHQAYIDNLNKVVAENPDVGKLELWTVLTTPDSVPEHVRQTVRNNLGGYINHSAFWQLMTPDRNEPPVELAEAINRDFGSLAEMQSAVNEAGLKRFGSGWAWLVSNKGVLSVLSTPNQDHPLMTGAGVAVIGIDVWEHAYYLGYQNRRKDYLEAWWNVINWEIAAREYRWSTSADFM